MVTKTIDPNLTQPILRLMQIHREIEALDAERVELLEKHDGDDAIGKALCPFEVNQLVHYFDAGWLDSSVTYKILKITTDYRFPYYNIYAQKLTKAGFPHNGIGGKTWLRDVEKLKVK